MDEYLVLDEITRSRTEDPEGPPVSSQAFATMLQNKLYVGIVNVPGYGVVGKRGELRSSFFPTAAPARPYAPIAPSNRET